VIETKTKSQQHRKSDMILAMERYHMNKHGQSMVYFIGKKYMTKVSTEIL
jgi:hypothetical protein